MHSGLHKQTKIKACSPRGYKNQNAENNNIQITNSALCDSQSNNLLSLFLNLLSASLFPGFGPGSALNHFCLGAAQLELIFAQRNS